MSEQIREQVSAFLDGELPNSETELLLKRLTRDGELRESFGRYALIGEALRGSSSDVVTRGFASRVNLAIDGEPAQVAGQAQRSRSAHWWRPLAGVGVAAGVAAVAIVALQQRSISPMAPVAAQNIVAQSASNVRESLSYTVPASSPAAPSAIAPARLTNYVFAHSKYSSGLGRRGVLADLLIEDDENAPPPAHEGAVKPALAPDAHVAP